MVYIFPPQALWSALRIPVLALTDADPYGLHIAAVYKFGTQAREDDGLTLEAIAWLGVLPSDLPSLQLPRHALQPLTPQDHAKLAALQQNPQIAANEGFMRQVGTSEVLYIEISQRIGVES